MLWPDPGQAEAVVFFQREVYELPLARMQVHRMAFLDTLILNLAERTANAEAFVTWNARHFREKSALTVFTPAEYLTRLSQG